MKTDKYLLLITEELKNAPHNKQVEVIILQSIADIEKKEGADLIKPFLIKLRSWLEDLSPLDCDSTQWGRLRYAVIYLRESLMMEIVLNGESISSL